MLMMIDNYDSFTYNLVQYFDELGAETTVFRNDQISVSEIAAMKPCQIVISPGPGIPDNAGISLELIKRFAGEIPILGVCLGMQAIGQSLGGKIVHAQTIKHGKTSSIHHKGTGIFNDIQSPFTATRYHSLVIERKSLPAQLEEIAWTDEQQDDTTEIMGIRHQEYPLTGVQFHPESILTDNGHKLLENFLNGKV